MSVQYRTVVDWDATLIDLEFVGSDASVPTAIRELVKYAVKITTGAPTATAGKFIRGAQVANAISGVTYINTGTTASPVFQTVNVT